RRRARESVQLVHLSVRGLRGPQHRRQRRTGLLLQLVVGDTGLNDRDTHRGHRATDSEQRLTSLRPRVDELTARLRRLHALVADALGRPRRLSHRLLVLPDLGAEDDLYGAISHVTNTSIRARIR